MYYLAVFGAAGRAVMLDIEPLMGRRRRERIVALHGRAVQPRLIEESRACYDVRVAA